MNHTSAIVAAASTGLYRCSFPRITRRLSVPQSTSMAIAIVPPTIAITSPSSGSYAASTTSDDGSTTPATSAPPSSPKAE